jgi:hypothetical protein
VSDEILTIDGEDLSPSTLINTVLDVGEESYEIAARAGELRFERPDVFIPKHLASLVLEINVPRPGRKQDHQRSLRLKERYEERLRRRRLLMSLRWAGVRHRDNTPGS